MVRLVRMRDTFQRMTGFIALGFIACTLATLTSFIPSTDSLAQEPAGIPDWLSNKVKLKKEKWEKSGYLSAITEKWPAYDGEQGLDEKDILKRTELEIMGVRFRAEQHKYRKDETQELVSYNLDPYPESFCKSIFGKLTASLGKTNNVAEISHPGYESISSSWETGNSIIRFQCS